MIKLPDFMGFVWFGDPPNQNWLSLYLSPPGWSQDVWLVSPLSQPCPISEFCSRLDWEGTYHLTFDMCFIQSSNKWSINYVSINRMSTSIIIYLCNIPLELYI
jgi:hypothetical protein